MFFKPKYLFGAILFLAIVLRLWGLGSAELFHDEGFYAFRSIGYLDYLQNDNQTTPIQWFAETTLPRWVSLSFHDHPPLFFLIQNVFFRLFGESLLVARLPSLFAGIASIILVYILAKRLFKNEYAGLLGALLLGINHIHIWISRSSLIESLLIFLILLNIYAFFRFLDDRRKWLLFGVTLGLCFLTKYISIFLVPAYGIYLLITHRDFYRRWQLYAALVLTLVLFSPVLIYNFYLWQTTGHFDLQFAYLFGQETPEWTSSLGKIQEPFANLGVNLAATYSISSLLAAAGGLIYSLFLWRKQKSPLLIFGWLVFVFITLVFVAVGSAYRFISLYAVPLVFFIVLLFSYFYQKSQKKLLFKILFIVFIAYELFFTIGGIFFLFPDHGVARLDRYLDGILGDQRSLAVAKSSNPHLDQIIRNNLGKYAPAEKPLMIIYDENISLSQRLWLFTRRMYYHGIPTVTVGQFKKFLRIQGLEAFAGYELYFIKATGYTALNQQFSTPDALEFENFLQQEFNASPEKIIYYKNFPMFRVYKFLL